MKPGDSQLQDWSHGGHTVPGGVDDLGRRCHRISPFPPGAAAACQAPRTPRIPRKRNPVLSADSPDGTSNQGRDFASRLEPTNTPRGYGLTWWLCMSAAAVAALAFAIAG